MSIRCTLKPRAPALAVVAVAGLSAVALANPGDLVKFSQPLVPMTGTPNPMWIGADHGSDLDWRFLMQPGPQAWVVADDFPSIPGTPITGVRWYGSYFDPMFLPQPDPVGGLATFEDGWVISFHRDMQPVVGGPPFSQPTSLVGTYVASPDVVQYRNTGIVGWDGHLVWEYTVAIKDMCIAHGTPGEAEPGRFTQRQTDNNIYWISIAAENGHDIIPGGTPDNWTSVPNADPILTSQHFWGWHSSPVNFMDRPVMGGLTMPTTTQWLYGPWEPIIDQHGGVGMAFELYIPSPGVGALAATGALMLLRRRRTA